MACALSKEVSIPDHLLAFYSGIISLSTDIKCDNSNILSILESACLYLVCNQKTPQNAGGSQTSFNSAQTVCTMTWLHLYTLEVWCVV